MGVQEVGALEDAELLRRFVAARDEAAFEVLVWRHGPVVLGVCQRLLGDAHAAEDAFQATFLALAREAGRVSRGGAVGGWLYRVAYRVALKAKRRTARQAECERRRPLPDSALPPEDLAWRDLRPVLDDEINRLPAKYRQPVLLCYLEGKTNTEAARLLGCPAGTVATRLAWARARLRGRLTRRGVSLPAAALGLALAGEGARAAPAAPLVVATVRLGTSWAAGSAAAAATQAGPLGLTKEVMRRLFLDRLKRIVLIAAGGAALIAGVGIGSYRALGGKGTPASAQDAPAEPAPPRRSAGEVLDQARDSARKIADPAERVAALVQLAASQGRAGDKAAGLKTLEAALRAAGALEEATPKGMALREIAEAQVQLGDSPAACRTAGLAEGPGQKNQLLFLIAGKQAEGGDIAGALRTTDTITDYEKDNALASVACAQARAGDVKGALRTADSLKHQPLEWASALEAIAVAQAKAGDRATAAANLREALRLDVSTLAQEDDRNTARARVAAALAQVGDVRGALASAADLKEDAARNQVLGKIAAEQVRAGDPQAALRTVAEIADAEARIGALRKVAAAQVETRDRAAALATLRTARDLADSLKDQGKRESCRWAVAGAQVEAGDVRPALALVRSHPRDEGGGPMLLAVAEAQLASGDRAGAAATMRPAWDRAAALVDRNADPMGVLTLVPIWAIMKGHRLRQAAAGLAAAGEAEDAYARAAGQETPYFRTMALLGVAEGMRQYDQRPQAPHP
jgi:RNA polymerase sigma factor (sigma-70 family)